MYCSVADVQARLGVYLQVSASSTPNTAQIEGWIQEASLRIDSVLQRRGYLLIPAPGERDRVLLGGVVADKVALQVLYTVFAAPSVPEGARETLAGYRDFVRELAQGQRNLLDQTPRLGQIASVKVKRG